MCPDLTEGDHIGISGRDLERGEGEDGTHGDDAGCDYHGEHHKAGRVLAYVLQ